MCRRRQQNIQPFCRFSIAAEHKFGKPTKIAGVNVGDPFAISVSPSEGYFFDTANAATKLRVVRKDNGGEIPLVQDGNPNPVPGTDGEWIYRYTAMPDCGVKVEVVFDKIVYWVQLNTQDEDGNALNAAGYWKFTVNKKDNLVENSVTDAFIEYGDTVTIALTEAGCNIMSAATQTGATGVARLRFLIELSDASMLNPLLARVSRVPSVYDARRIMPGEGAQSLRRRV